MFDNLVAGLKKRHTTLVFTEGADPRILSAAARLKREGIAEPLLIGSPEEVRDTAKGIGAELADIRIIDPLRYRRMDALAEKMHALRGGKLSLADCRAQLQKGNYFGTMLVKMGIADGLLGGATYSTADTVRPALQLIRTKPGASLVSSCFLLVPKPGSAQKPLVMADCAINLHPSAEELAEIAAAAADCARLFEIDPQIAFLSYSTKGSGKGPDVDKMRRAAELAKAARPGLAIEGELQFDAAVSPEVARTKCPGLPVAGQANTFIFPDINAGNIGYKIAQRLGGYDAFGPILLGLNAPVNDLSRGCSAEEVYYMAVITAGLRPGG